MPTMPRSVSFVMKILLPRKPVSFPTRVWQIQPIQFRAPKRGPSRHSPEAKSLNLASLPTGAMTALVCDLNRSFPETENPLMRGSCTVLSGQTQTYRIIKHGPIGPTLLTAFRRLSCFLSSSHTDHPQQAGAENPYGSRKWHSGRWNSGTKMEIIEYKVICNRRRC